MDSNPFSNPSDEVIQSLLQDSKTIAVVGLSENENRGSYKVASILQSYGYKIIPVNPSASVILNETAYAKLEDIPHAVDIVNVFRRSEYTPEIAEEAAEIGAKAFWLQLGIYNEEAANIAIDRGMTVVMDRCIKIEYQRLMNNDSNIS